MCHRCVAHGPPQQRLRDAQSVVINKAWSPCSVHHPGPLAQAAIVTFFSAESTDSASSIAWKDRWSDPFGGILAAGLGKTFHDFGIARFTQVIGKRHADNPGLWSRTPEKEYPDVLRPPRDLNPPLSSNRTVSSGVPFPITCVKRAIPKLVKLLSETGGHGAPKGF